MSELTATSDALGRLQREIARVAPGKPTVVAQGKFDGVHLGHQALIRAACDRARDLGAVPGAITYDPLPYVAFNPGVKYHYLCSLEERIRLLQAAGAQFVAILPFDREISRLTATEFVGSLRTGLSMVELVVGPDAALGRDREGTVDRLSEIGRDLGFSLLQVPAVMNGGERVQTSSIRRQIYDGNVAAAARGLGRCHFIEGEVVGGDQRGRDLGYPTANLLPPEHLVMPADGIYGCWASWDDQRRPAAVSIGVRPTFGEGLRRLVEAHVLDFRGNLYGKTLRLEFVNRVRGEEKFDSVDALIARIEADISEIRRELAL